MLISKFDLYKPEWLELVFENRNKEYGAYELRQHNGRTMAMAMGITFFVVGSLGAASIISSKGPIHHDRGIVVTVQPPPTIVIPPKKVVPPEVKPLKSLPPATPPATTKFVQMRVVVDPVAAEPPKIDELANSAIGPETVKGPTSVSTNVMPVETPGNDGPTEDNTIHNVGFVDVMPEPVGGQNAWNKFLSKNLRFPPAAQEEGVSGRAIMSFVIEKDGTLSNITVERAGGHGFDEEAVRVLKLAKAWKPGIQNGQPVRVKYMIPINFQLSSDN